MPAILITDEARQYLEMVLPGITGRCQYNRNQQLWQLTLDADVIAAITNQSRIGETFSDTIVRGVRLQLGIKPH